MPLLPCSVHMGSTIAVSSDEYCVCTVVRFCELYRLKTSGEPPPLLPSAIVSLLRTVTTHLQDVVITTGCAGALDLAISSMAGPGDNLLIPMPGFPGYNITIASQEVECRQYKLLVSMRA